MKLRLCLLALTFATLGHATVELPAIFASHMVLQRNQPIPVWGTRATGETVTVRLRDASGGIQAEASDTTSGETSWRITLPAQSASVVGSPLTLEIVGTNTITLDPVQIGEVWLCSGQSNLNFLMRPYSPYSEGVLDYENEIANSTDEGLAFFTTLPEANETVLPDVHGAWRPAVPTYVAYTSAVPYYFGHSLRQNLGVPVGIIVSALGATSIKAWSEYSALAANPAAASFLSLHAGRLTTYADAIATYHNELIGPYRDLAVQNLWQPTFLPPYPEPEDYPTWRYQPAGLYQAMIAPLSDYAVRGFAWYQGESDSSDSANYTRYLEDMIDSWRAARGGAALPFLVVQIANYEPETVGDNPALAGTWALQREAQQAAVDSTPGTALIVAADVGNPTAIHPRDKKTVGDRLGLAARRVAYGESSLVISGPRYSSFEINGSTVAIHFTDVGGGLVIDTLRATGTGPSFQLAGGDGVFYDATPTISGSQVLLTSASVTHPLQVRYGFHNNPHLILYNVEGLPAPPFRASLPIEPVATWEFGGSSLAVTSKDVDVNTAACTLGPAIGTTGFSASRGNPVPSLFIRADATPSDLATAVSTGSYVEFRLNPVNAHGFDLTGASLTFDIARSTTIADFGYAVRWSVDNFATDLAAATITSANETFIPVSVSLNGPELAIGTDLVVRIYLWDGTADSSRVTRLDNIVLRSILRYDPALALNSLSNTNLELSWAGVDGREYRIHESMTLLDPRPWPVLADHLLCGPTGRVAHAITPAAERAFYLISEQP